MRRSVANSQSLGVSLFPFLAVLLCTMGALIVVLIVLSRQAQAQAAQTAQIAAAEADENAETARRLLEYRIEQLRVQREKTKADLANRRFVLGQVEDHWRQLETRLVELRRAYNEYDNVLSADVEGQDARRQELEALERQAAAAAEALDKARQEAATRRPSFAVVPYDGPNATRRRPIYVECRSDAIVLQPEGVQFSVADFAGPLGPSNALSSGVRAVREYVAGLQKNNPQPQEPYPLLLVRPDGIEAYYLARLALADWDTEFGYEMIEADWPLEFPPADATLRDIVQQAVDDARVRQRLLAEHAPRQFGQQRSRTFRAAPGGGVVAVDESGGRDPAPTRGGAGLGRRGSGGPIEGGRSGSRFAGGGEEAGSFGSNGGRLGNGDVDADQLPYAAGLASDGAGDDRTPNGGDGKSAAGPGQRAASSTGENRGDGEASPGEAPQGFGRSLRGDPSTRGTSAESHAAGRSSATRGNAPAAGASTGAPNLAASGSAAGSDPSEGQVGVGAPTIDFSKPASQAPSLAQSRGKDWGIPESVRHATPVGRPIRLECHGDRLILHSSSRTVRGGCEIPFDGPTQSAVDELVSAIWDEVELWGLAGQGMYWRPTLNCDISPDGQTRYADLQRLLDDSGLELKARGVTASRPIQPLSAPVKRAR